MATNNATILHKAWLNGTNDYQQRIPNVTTAGVARVSNALYDPMNRDLLNYFAHFLVNRIGGQRINSRRWESPLNFLKGDNMPFGHTFMETSLAWVKAHSFIDDDVKTETLLKTHFPEGLTAFHSRNRADVYEASINYDELRMAFTSETGLTEWTAAQMDVLYNSDEYDTYRLMLQLLAEHDKNHGIFRTKVNAVTDKASADEMLIELRAFADILSIPSTLYNAQDVQNIPVFAKSRQGEGNDSLLLITTPRVNARLDVLGLAAAFNMDRANYKYDKVVVDELPFGDDVEAILTVPETFIIKDTVYQMTDFWNPHTLTTNYYLHHQSINSISPFTPMIAFTTSETIEIPVITQEVTGMQVTEPEYVVANDPEGGQFLIDLMGSISPEVPCEVISVKPDSAIFKVVSVAGADGDIAYSPADVFFDDYGVLRVFTNSNPELAEAVTAGALTVNATATSTYTNPSGETEEFTEEIAFTNVVPCPEPEVEGE